MITYIKDHEKTYEKDLIKHLRGHNETFTGKVEFKDIYAYLVEGQNLIGAIQVSNGWNWATISKVFYKDKEVLRKLIVRVFQEIKAESIGIKFFSPIKSRYHDFISVGFEHSNHIIGLGEYEEFYYANYTGDNVDLDSSDVMITYEPNEVYQEILTKKEKAFEISHNIRDKQGEFMWIALEDDVCVGGISGDYYEKTIYVSRLAVDPRYKHQGIGTKLMMIVEEDARSKGYQFIELGTTDFQARPFYEKLGYKVIHTMHDYPKGYNCYSLNKSLT